MKSNRVLKIISKNYRQIKNEKNVVFYPKKKSQYLQVSSKLIQSIKSCAKKNKKNIFLCLHNSPNDKFHNMIIFLWKGSYYSPHKHTNKEEIINVLEGKKRIILHKSRGKKEKKILLDVKHNPIVRINKNILHSVDVLSKYVVYHEIKPGPFNSRNR
jgi:cupin fold WbuC family metalloprotein